MAPQHCCLLGCFCETKRSSEVGQKHQNVECDGRALDRGLTFEWGSEVHPLSGFTLVASFTDQGDRNETNLSKDLAMIMSVGHTRDGLMFEPFG